ncbi:outer membrane protein assembly factor BamE [Bartonella sp. TP]|uniref:outer membrane protein assembly factor BamE n=1 Tax=Bartonella sp. TP TaxID=3057550 RepID=UPI0025B06CA6|nr:outer membrane protein assembly factor BamE [Bartonella sp. TP]WJW80008.1 outer membrane protein assembly factor BamE [Bartonella sp. TP]
MQNNAKKFKALLLIGGLLTSGLSLSACNISHPLGMGQVISEGYVPDKYDLMAVKIGSSQKQVLLAMGTPTVKTIYNKNDVYYYISQRRYRQADFLSAKIVDRKIYAVYFDTNHRVVKLSNYGLKDGRIFNFSTNSTPSIHQADNGFLNKIMGSTRVLPYGLGATSH